jgi:hypothetical protein
MIEARAALALRKRNPGQSKLRRLLKKSARKMARFVQLFRERLHFRFRKFAYALLQQLLFFGKFQVHAVLPGNTKLLLTRLPAPYAASRKSSAIPRDERAFRRSRS